MFEWRIAFRYFRSRRRVPAFFLMNFLTIFGVALGVFAMIVVIAVMNGLETDVKEKLLKVTSHIFISKINEEPMKNWESVARSIRTTSHVEAIAPGYFTTGIVSAGGRTEPVIVKGIYPDLEQNVIDIKKIMKEGSYSYFMDDPPAPGFDDEPPGRIVMGLRISTKLGLLPKEHTRLVLTVNNKTRVSRMVYLGAFETGFDEYDANLVLVPFEDLQRLYGIPADMTALQLRIDDISLSGDVANEISRVLGTGYEVKDWRSIHENLFAAMSLEKKAMSVILFILILVAASGIAGGVAILITNKRKEIGILKSVGAQDRSILTIFLLEGLTIGISGILAGGVAGVVFCYLADRYKLIRINIELFDTFHVPFHLQAWDLCMIASGAIIICMIASLLPAWKASRLDPIRAIRE